MTFDELRSAVESFELTHDQRATLRRAIRAKVGVRRGPEKGLRCATNHPGIESVWIPRTETRWSAKGQPVNYVTTYCKPCMTRYETRDRYAELNS